MYTCINLLFISNKLMFQNKPEDVINATLIPSFQLSFSFLSAFLFTCLKGPIGGSFVSIFFFIVEHCVALCFRHFLILVLEFPFMKF